MVVKMPKYRTFAKLMHRLGDVPLERVRFDPFPGTAVVADVDRIQAKEGRTCELVEGVLVEKPMGMAESFLALYLGELLNHFVRPNNLPESVLGESGTIQNSAQPRPTPDVAFISWDRFPKRRLPKEAVPLVVPNLAVEVLSKSNTRKEMAIKREE